MFAVGLTGGIGSGKSTVAEVFSKHGVPIVDTDVIAHRITGPQGQAMPLISAEFGQQFVAPDGSLDRAAMRARVFSNEAARQRLEAITHPLIRAEAEREQHAAYGPYVIVAVPLLVESGGWRERVNRILVVDCATETQILRVQRRNAFTRNQVLAIMARQASRAERLQAADDVILNEDENHATLDARIHALHQRYLLLAKPRAF
ncbi:dephospho-CoA kinase [Paraburkholderia bonniea]|uniref:dephospho-CoA kinase n=1 Tax=Paraburkholderia bonniea TaxID=2152891 RepID=UPI00129272C6|nr:dephospho-CoA kinase [Paraburkholderia bonniea]WJF90671.1 dephospho-CoA kinase [Paraburkholderia bonniea]WJF93985.1 dephospho-CoA kinase [Paraburkholderia bonniea]